MSSARRRQVRSLPTASAVSEPIKRTAALLDTSDLRPTGSMRHARDSERINIAERCTVTFKYLINLIYYYIIYLFNYLINLIIY